MLLKSKMLVAVLVIIFNAIAFSQENTANNKRVIITKKISTGKITLDGLLNESEWKMVLPATNFIQKDPVEGAPSTEKQKYMLYMMKIIFISELCYLIVIRMEFLLTRNAGIRAFVPMIVLCGF